MNDVTLNGTITLIPREIDSNYKTTLYQKLVKKTANKCSKEGGYVLAVLPDIEILGNTADIHGSADFRIRYTVQTLKPYEGQKLTGTVCMVFEKGVLIKIKGQMTVLIPEKRLVGYKYDEHSNSFKCKRKKIAVGVEIDVEIKLIEYRDMEFQCIGCLYESED